MTPPDIKVTEYYAARHKYTGKYLEILSDGDLISTKCKTPKNLGDTADTARKLVGLMPDFFRHCIALKTDEIRFWKNISNDHGFRDLERGIEIYQRYLTEYHPDNIEIVKITVKTQTDVEVV